MIRLDKESIVHEQMMDDLKELLPLSAKVHRNTLGTYYEVMNDLFNQIFQGEIKDGAAKERKYQTALCKTKKSVDSMISLTAKTSEIMRKYNGNVEKKQWEEINNNVIYSFHYNVVVSAYVEELRACIDDPKHYHFPKFGEPESRKTTPLYVEMLNKITLKFEEIEKDDKAEWDFVEEEFAAFEDI